MISLLAAAIAGNLADLECGSDSGTILQPWS